MAQVTSKKIPGAFDGEVGRYTSLRFIESPGASLWSWLSWRWHKIKLEYSPFYDWKFDLAWRIQKLIGVGWANRRLMNKFDSVLLECSRNMGQATAETLSNVYRDILKLK